MTTEVLPKLNHRRGRDARGNLPQVWGANQGYGDRKPKYIAVNNVCDTLRACSSVVQAAGELDCSRRYIYKVLKNQGTIPKDVIEAKAK